MPCTPSNAQQYQDDDFQLHSRHTAPWIALDRLAHSPVHLPCSAVASKERTEVQLAMEAALQAAQAQYREFATQLHAASHERDSFAAENARLRNELELASEKLAQLAGVLEERDAGNGELELQLQLHRRRLKDAEAAAAEQAAEIIRLGEELEGSVAARWVQGRRTCAVKYELEC